MIKPLNAVQNNGCDIFLVHSALGLLLIALVTVLLITLSSAMLHFLIFVLSCSLTRLSLSSSSISISVYILIWCNTFSSNSWQRVPEKIDHLHICICFIIASLLSGDERDLAIFSQALPNRNNFLRSFSGWTTFHSELIWVLVSGHTLTSLLWL